MSYFGYAQGYALAKEISDIDNELKRLSKISKDLRNQKKRAQEQLRQHMERYNVDKIEKVTLKSLQPKTRAPLKPKKKRKQDAIQLFREIGAPNPEELWEDFQRTQRVIQ